jgi:hypothetical protein
MFWVPNEFLFEIGGGRAVPNQLVIAVSSGFVIAIIADALIRAFRGWRHRQDEGAGAG